ncbi:MAG: ribosome rescue protein RqcH [Nitrososphaeria archaeon]|nr:ribosome rescue protein RqcH [Nitrososphaeria archaeon]
MEEWTLNNIELFHQARWLNGNLKDYYVNNVYWAIVNRTLVIRLHHPTYPEKRLVIDNGKAIWVTEIKLEEEGSDQLLRQFRNFLARGKISKITQFGTERIIDIEFIGSLAKHLIAEFFSRGNIILVDEKNVILTALEYYQTRHRIIAVGKEYQTPPERGLDPLKADIKHLKPMLKYDDDFRKWIGKNLALPKKYIDMLPKILGVKEGTKGNELDEEKIIIILDKIKEFFREENIRPVIYLDDNNVVDFSIIPNIVEGLVQQNVQNLNEALDKIFTKIVLQEKEKDALYPLIREKEKTKKAIDELTNKKDQMTEDGKLLTELANKIRANLQLLYQDYEEFKKTLLPAKIEKDEDGIEKIVYKSYTFEFDKNRPLKTCSEIYDMSKMLVEDTKKIEESISEMYKEIEKIEKKIMVKEKIISREHKKTREREWFEKYRWFYTSEDMLAIGGRDASSNEAIIKKYLEDEDIVFHAEIVGAPFFILKKGTKAGENSLKEVAIAAVSFSNFWKMGASAGEAYWVYKNQISKQAPSGQYMGKGAFMISGKRNYIRNLPIELAVGVVKVKEHYSVVCGPIDAVKKRCENYLVIVPGNEDKNSIAKKIVKYFYDKTGEVIKDIPFEEFIQALPPGGCKLKNFNL